MQEFKELTLLDLISLRSELVNAINVIALCGFLTDTRCNHFEYDEVRYKRLVKLHDKIDNIILDKFDELGL